MDSRIAAKVPGAWLLIALIGAISLVSAGFGEAGRLALRWQRGVLESGEWWRLLSAHVVHLGWPHTILNVTALLVLGAIFAPIMRTREWLVAAVGAALGIDLGLFVLALEIDWYVGLSGVLHGLFAAGVLALAAHERRLALVLALALLIKLVVEALYGPSAATAAMTGGDVVTEAHLYGAVSGAVALGLLRAVGARRGGPV